jgi:hypothetical protein
LICGARENVRQPNRDFRNPVDRLEMKPNHTFDLRVGTKPVGDPGTY